MPEGTKTEPRNIPNNAEALADYRAAVTKFDEFSDQLSEMYLKCEADEASYGEADDFRNYALSEAMEHALDAARRLIRVLDYEATEEN